MGTFSITSSKIESQYSFVDDDIIVYGAFSKDGFNGELKSLNGSCYRNENGNVGAHFGDFKGTPASDGEILYDLSPMRRADKNLAWDAIDEIEPQILDNGTNTGEE